MSELVDLLDQLAKAKAVNKIADYEPYEFQKNFHHAKDEKGVLAKQVALMCANQIGKCVTYQTLIDLADGTTREIGKLYDDNKEFEVMAWSDNGIVKATATKVIKKPPEECYRVTLSDGKWFECANNHKLLTNQGWKFFYEVNTSWQSLPSTSLEYDQLIRAVSEPHYSETSLDCQDDYLACQNRCDEQPQSVEVSGQAFPPLQAYVRQHICHLYSFGVLAYKGICNLFDKSLHLSSRGVCLQTSGQFEASLSQETLSDCQSFGCEHQNEQQYPCSSYPRNVADLIQQGQFQSSSCGLLTMCGNEIIDIHSVGAQDLYDVSVPQYGNYITQGVVHHNTFSAANAVTYHATGEYPDWWEGKRFSKPVNIMVSGQTNDTTRDICQNELLGDPFGEDTLGTGSIPKSKIGKTTRKAGVPHALSAVMVKHVSGGNSKIRFMAYEQGNKAFMGIRFDILWGDEEPPSDVWTQMIRATFSRKDYLIMLTFTPESGVTELIASFMNDLKEGQALIRAGWEDAAHMTPEKIEAYLKQLPPHEREMRSKGIPLMGSGLVFPVSDESIMIDPFPIPAHWPRICGIDFGIAHPFAAAWIAFDRDTGTAYVYDCFRVSGQLPPMHASAIKKRDAWMPIVWPHDGLNTDKASGIPLAESYREEGLNLLPNKFSNPPSVNQQEGQGGNGVEVGLFSMLTAMEESCFKVFSNQILWFEEKNMYHRSVGANGKTKIVDVREDLMSATRYAYQSERFARTKPIPPKRKNVGSRMKNW